MPLPEKIKIDLQVGIHSSYTPCPSRWRTPLQVSLNKLPADLHRPASRKWLTGRFAEDLTRLSSGQHILDTHVDTQLEIVKLGLIPVVETAIEGKHSVATRRRTKTRGGLPVQESLANRKQMLLRPLQREQGQQNRPFLESLLACWSQARTLKAVPRLLGFDNADFQEKLSRHARARVLAEAIYRTDLTLQYQDLSQQQQANRKAVALDHLHVAVAQARKGAIRKRLCLDNVWRHAMQEHLRVRHTDENMGKSMYALPSDLATIRALTSSAGPASQALVFSNLRWRDISATSGLVDSAYDEEEAALVPGCLEGPPQPPHPLQSHVCFRILKTRPSQGKYLRSMGLDGDSLAIALHEV